MDTVDRARPEMLLMHFHFCMSNHNEVGRRTLRDMYLWLQSGLKALGHTVTLSETECEPGALNVFWEYFMPGVAEELRESGVRYGLIATEIFDGRGFNYLRDGNFTQRWKGFCTAAEGASFIWSMVASNLPVLEWFAPSAYIDLGFCDDFRFDDRSEPDIDFSFLGFHTPYRKELLDRFARRASVVTPGRILTFEERNDLMLRTRINLSLKQSEQWLIPSPTRTGLALMAKRGLAAERTLALTRPAEIAPMAAPGEDYVDFALAQLNGPWKKQAEAAYERFRTELPMRRIMETALDDTVSKMSSARRGAGHAGIAKDVLCDTMSGAVASRGESREAGRVVASLIARLNQVQYGPAGDPDVIHLAGAYSGFNLVHYQGKAYGLRQTLGVVNVTDGDAALKQRYSAEDLVIGESAGEVRARIDVIEAARHVSGSEARTAAMVSAAEAHAAAMEQDLRTILDTLKAASQDVLRSSQEMSARLGGLESKIETRVSPFDLEAAVKGIGERLDGLDSKVEARVSPVELEAALQSVGERLEALDAQLQTRVSQIDLDAAAAAVRNRLDAIEMDVHSAAAEASAAAAERQLEIDQNRDGIQEVRSGLDARLREYRLMAQQIKFLQYGPGDPQQPCPAGDHRGFALVHYQGRVFGLRKPLDPSEVLTDPGRLANCDSHEVISGDSLDGVRARIDALENASALHGELVSLRNELLAMHSGTTEAMRQMNAVLQKHGLDLGRLDRAWPNRIWNRFSSTNR